MKKLILTVLFLFFLPMYVWATDYYIDPDAGGGGDGSIETPFDSWADIDGTPAFACGNSYKQAVDTTEALDPTADSRLLLSSLNCSGNEIEITSYGTGAKPIITTRHEIGDTGWTLCADGAPADEARDCDIATNVYYKSTTGFHSSITNRLWLDGEDSLEAGD